MDVMFTLWKGKYARPTISYAQYLRRMVGRRYHTPVDGGKWPHLARKIRRWYTFNARAHGKQAARQWLVCEIIGTQIGARGGDI